MDLRIAFSGASGTGKSTLAQYLAQKFDLPINPVGSRSVSAAMGFANPYDVDAAGRRVEFQRRLLTEKCAWEAANDSFITDRTTLDNLLYTIMHDVASVDATIVGDVVAGLHRYTHVVYCPFASFCNVAGDPSRVADRTYHEIYDALINGLLTKYVPAFRLGVIWPNDLIERTDWLDAFLVHCG